MQQSPFFAGPRHQQTGNLGLKWIIWITVLATLLSPLVSYGLEHLFHFSGPAAWLPLSRFGLQQGWLWEPLTYFFLHSAGMGISLSLLIGLFFNMVLLWFSGSDFAMRHGTLNFLLFYLGAGLAAGLVSTLLILLFSSQAILVGSTPAIFALIMIWAMHYPDLELFFFFVIRIKAKWLAALFLSLSLLIKLSAGAFIPFWADITGIVWGFCIGRFMWKMPNPFPLNLDLPRRKKPPPSYDDKIIDIAVFQEDDDAFMDRMLEKIATEGKESLTKREQERMRKISERKHKSH